MAYVLRFDRPLDEELRIVACSEVDAILALLRQASARGAGKPVHEIRKHLKKLRSLLALAHGSLDPDARVQDDHAFRAVARALGPTRESAVRWRTARAVMRDRPLSPTAMRELRRALGLAPDAIAPDVQVEIAAALVALRTRIEAWTFAGAGFSLVEDGLRRSYRRARREYETCLESARPEDFHEWRKDAKHVYHHVRLLAGLWPELLEAHARELDRLSDQLGDDHDLDDLERAVEQAFDEEPTWVSGFRQRIRARSRALRADALVLGARLFAERPKAMVRRFRDYYAPRARGTDG